MCSINSFLSALNHMIWFSFPSNSSIQFASQSSNKSTFRYLETERVLLSKVEKAWQFPLLHEPTPFLNAPKE